MRINFKVKPGAKVEKIEKLSESDYLIWIRAQAQEGKANLEAIKALSDYLDIPKSRITILKGHTSRTKLIEIV